MDETMVHTKFYPHIGNVQP